ncbi:Antibiotic biosynthesis monooxygenase [Cyclobacterium lianum]|uniref:Antibiotic biosynthesis monooxygenase n=1 Tax=Cyclobacterium lianum TaxID=388280 RepID=A0A1M7LID6_9BACT|nr:antibiotic biosynthesis monooxygenase family protein [Cyclobacterium lianum]SHM77827.1 Antibiotic biosynthesis monooxygenase [Cyclobacterium lianum]
MIAAISKFTVQNGMEEKVKDAFRDRPKFVEGAPGFIKMDVLSPLADPAEIHLITYWESENDFDYWHCNHLKASHGGIPKGLRLVPHSWTLTRFEYICS